MTSSSFCHTRTTWQHTVVLQQTFGEITRATNVRVRQEEANKNHLLCSSYTVPYQDDLF